MSFSFGSPVTPKTASGFTLPTASTPGVSSSGAAGDNKIQNKPASTLFGTPTTSVTGFSLGATAPTGGYSFGTPTTASGFAPTAAATAPAAGFSLTASTASPATTGFTLGAATGSPGFGLGTASTAATTPKTTATLSFGVTTTPSAATPKFNLSTPATSTGATPQFSLATPAATIGSATTTTATSFTPILGAATSLSSPAVSTPLKLSTSLPSVTATGSETATTTTIQPLSTVSTAPATSTTASTALPATGSLTYAQLEDSINKWTLDLEEQGKFFINQAKQLNAWDSLLMANGEKILKLNETIERVKQQQKDLDQELDFVLSQQNELEELTRPLEKELVELPIADQNRFQTYQLGEIIDTQLKQMSEDLKEIVEHLNEVNKEEDLSDPMVQVSRILNAHMNSLQWIDRNSTQISSHLDQISKLYDMHKKSHINL